MRKGDKERVQNERVNVEYTYSRKVTMSLIVMFICTRA